MADVIGPNGVKTYVPDDVARSLVGTGERGYTYAPEAREPEEETPKPPTPKRTTRRTTKSSAD